jgi:hypothetical protein
MGEPESPDEVSRLRPLIERTQASVSHFAVGGLGIFYFGRIDDAWWLLVINTADCSA